ncbi:MAG: HAMP domain-containing sensor histidine kinase [Nannocystaceae bacterium]
MSTFFEEIKNYVGFGPRDSACLKVLLGPAQEEFHRIADHFYELIFRHPEAKRAISGGEEQVQRLRHTLVEWMRSGLAGPHDEAFYERRARIGRVHVAIHLPQHFMFTAMNVMRIDFRSVVERSFGHDPKQRRAVDDAIDKLFDLELAIMIQTYSEDSEDRLRRRERLATIGQLAASIGHELRNPLGVMGSSVYLLRRKLEGHPEVGRHLDRISTQIDNCDDIVTNLSSMARDRTAKWQVLDFDALVADCLEALELPASVEMRTGVRVTQPSTGDRILLRQVVTNLARNAVQAVASLGGEVHVEIIGDSEKVSISVRDTGPGFDLDLLPRVFEPLVTSTARGTGLGLSLVARAADRLGGKVVAVNRPSGGAEVRLEYAPRPAE